MSVANAVRPAAPPAAAEALVCAASRAEATPQGVTQQWRDVEPSGKVMTLVVRHTRGISEQLRCSATLPWPSRLAG